MIINGHKIESKGKLRWANLHRADLCGADLCGADLREADLYRANLRRANLHEADLREANLYGADLREADLYRANLRRANLREANLVNARLPDFQIPQERSLIGYKKVDRGVITLEIPSYARRTATLISRKCRAEFAFVLDGSGCSNRGGIYVQGQPIYPDKYDSDPRVECTNGIHFFLTKEEAEEYRI